MEDNIGTGFDWYILILFARILVEKERERERDDADVVTSVNDVASPSS